MVTGFRNLTVLKESFGDFNKRPEEFGRLFNHIPDESGLKSINSPVFRLSTADFKMQSIMRLAILDISNLRH